MTEKTQEKKKAEKYAKYTPVVSGKSEKGK